MAEVMTGPPYRVKVDGATLPHHRGIVNHREREYESVEGVVHAAGDVIYEELGRAFTERLSRGDKHALSLVEVVSPEQLVTSPAGAVTVYDPTDHSVDDVVEYLGGASPEETERVLALEEQGKARKGVLEFDAGG